MFMVPWHAAEVLYAYFLFCHTKYFEEPNEGIIKENQPFFFFLQQMCRREKHIS